MRDELIERARRGDREAFASLAAGEVDRLNRLAVLIVRDPDLAQDAVQDTLVSCWRQLPKLRDVERFDGWLYRVLLHAARDLMRSDRRFAASVTLIAREPSVGDTSGQLADRDQLEAAFRRLSLDHRAVVVLHHYVGLPMTEVARSLGIPVGTAKSRHHYAMGALRAAIAADARTASQLEVPA